MKSSVFVFIGLAFTASAFAGVAGREKSYSCSASERGVSHKLTVVMREGVLAHIALSSVNEKNGNDCGIEVGNNTQQDSAGGEWEDWSGSALIRIKDGEFGPKSEVGQTLFVLKEPGGYRIFVSPEAGQFHCGLHGYLASSVGITVGQKKCKLTW